MGMALTTLSGRLDRTGIYQHIDATPGRVSSVLRTGGTLPYRLFIVRAVRLSERLEHLMRYATVEAIIAITVWLVARIIAIRLSITGADCCFKEVAARVRIERD